MEYYDPKLGLVDDGVLRTPFHQPGFYPDQKQKAEEITCQIGGTLRATVKNINLTPSDMIKLLTQLPANCHIISVEVSQFHHAESPEGEMYNSVKIEYQTDELMTKTPDPGVNIRSADDNPLGPNIVLCEYNQSKSDITADNTADTATCYPTDPYIAGSDFECRLLRAAIKFRTTLYGTPKIPRFIGVNNDYTKFEPITGDSDTRDMGSYRTVYDIETMSHIDSHEVVKIALNRGCDHLYTIALTSDPDKFFWQEYAMRKIYNLMRFLLNNHGIHIKHYKSDERDIKLTFDPDAPNDIIVTVRP